MTTQFAINKLDNLTELHSAHNEARAIPSAHARAEPVFELTNVEKRYRLGETEVAALRGISLEILPQEFLAIWGPSGSGKTSLLNILGLIDTPTSGELRIAGKSTKGLKDDALAALRNRTIGFVFQNFNLIPVLNALENVMLPLQIRGGKPKDIKARAEWRLNEVGLGEHMLQRPDQMSGGQRQRVAIARALIGDPVLVIADEPTANLDSENSTRIIELMRELNERDGVTFVFSTHDQRLLDKVDRRLKIADGRICTSEEA